MHPFNTGTAVRLGVAAVCLLAIHAIARATAERRASGDLELPPWRVEAIPLQLGGWQGKVEELDPRLFKAIGAVATRNIVYRNAIGQSVSLHCAVFEDETAYLPHLPQDCFPNSGYELQDEQTFRVVSGRGSPVDAKLMVWQRAADRLALLYWYQIGDTVLTDSSEKAAARFAELRHNRRPALCKFMLQTPLDESAGGRLGDVAGRVLEWTSRESP